MTQRLDYQQQSPELFKKLVDFSMATKKPSLGHTLLDLVNIRASQLNGCGFCLDMHVKEATIRGERPLRLHHVAIWRESTLFAPRERAALAWTEALTQLSPQGVPDELYDRVRTQLSEQEIVELTYAVMTINAWNRINVAFRATPGSHDKAFGLDKAQLA
ncbi:carboxymuconolactone decarboxylase family protein [Lysobacter yananisis]|uniref:Carboxymuconolactone decarboxylase family protein n=2 Tax=Lysobacter TaxID=68 RepID=A0A0S2DQ00_LYSEN|nr:MULTISPECIES: carboxymuconolactone decarboxylase family protein [Lysobacter]ALN60264.1 carboxymuconolactone decarboxylase family protein [Lysobacter enzymogenes]QCW28234.1 carboxymuconolactone decarboxylase family protein [Lysobacter enzymogenes]UZW61031.1 carboxymuconolactone decarboxylase family protein [Lysobacter enzymogenes]WMT04911.1 carboxymuconolactone decarboxylase family protein [Lysobacter yananisis]